MPRGRGDRGVHAFDALQRGDDLLDVPVSDDRVERRERAGADTRALQFVEGDPGRTGLGQRLGLRVAKLDRPRGDTSPASTAVEAIAVLQR